MRRDHPLLGSWIDTCEYGADMRYIVALRLGQIVITAIDTRDYEDENGNVYDVCWDSERLHFSVYWESSKDFTKCEFLLISPNRVSFTQRVTKQHILIRKPPTDETVTLKHTGILGTWINVEYCCSDLEYSVSLHDNQLIILALDTHDNEQGEIYDTYRDGETVRFAMYWISTGRFAKCQFVLNSPDQIAFTNIYTEQEILIREQNI
jgi:hypothetical protein